MVTVDILRLNLPKVTETFLQGFLIPLYEDIRKV